MDAIYTKALADLSVSLAELVVKGTASTIHAKTKAIKEVKDVEKVRATYDEIISELISEREEAVRIAQTYKAELERIVISDEDIQHLQNTVKRVLEILKEMSPETPFEQFEQFQELISADTLKALQLLGFNFKAAIGEPLTQLLAETILARTKTNNNQNKSKR